MGPARRALAASCAGLLLALAAPAWVAPLLSASAAAQDARPHKRPQPTPQPPAAPDAVGADNTTGPAQAPGASVAPRPPAVTPPVLHSAVQSRWSRPPTIARSTAAQCRAECAVQRSGCAEGALGGADTSGCDPGWSQCLSACDGLSYSRGGP